MIAIKAPSARKTSSATLSYRLCFTPRLWVGSWIVLALLTGCASQRVYDGPARPLEEVAIVDGWVTFNAARGGFKDDDIPPPRTIDDVMYGYLSLVRVDHNSMPKGADWAEILPGTHRVYYRFQMGRWVTSVRLELNAQAGHVYSVDGYILGRKLITKVIDITDTSDARSLKQDVAAKRK